MFETFYVNISYDCINFVLFFHTFDVGDLTPVFECKEVKYVLLVSQCKELSN